MTTQTVHFTISKEEALKVLGGYAQQGDLTATEIIGLIGMAISAKERTIKVMTEQLIDTEASLVRAVQKPTKAFSREKALAFIGDKMKKWAGRTYFRVEEMEELTPPTTNVKGDSNE